MVLQRGCILPFFFDQGDAIPPQFEPCVCVCVCIYTYIYIYIYSKFFYIYIYIYAFSRRFYPKRLTLHSSYSFYIWSALAFPGNRTHDLGVASAMLYQLSYREFTCVLDQIRAALVVPTSNFWMVMFIKSCWIKFPYKGLLIRVQIRWDIFQTGRICCYQTSWRREGYFNLVLGFLRDMKNALSELICSLCRPGFEVFLFSCLFSVLFTLEYVTFCIPKHCALKEPLIQWLKVTLINVLLLFQGQQDCVNW